LRYATEEPLIFITQLTAYGIVWWIAFAAVEFIAARLAGIWGIVAGHLLIAVVIAALDVQWVQSEMHKPGWNGQPDQDFVFVFSVLIRIILVNTLLLPVSGLGWVLGSSARQSVA
jgi:hypothetical protein